MNPNLAAVFIAIILGFAVVPWNVALQKITGGQLFVMFGIVYLIGGLFQMKYWSGTRPLTKAGIMWALGTAVIYFIAITGCNYVYGHPHAKLAVLAAITAGYPLVTAIFGAALKKQMLSWTEILFLLMAVGGIAGLSLSGKQA